MEFDEYILPAAARLSRLRPREQKGNRTFMNSEWGTLSRSFVRLFELACGYALLEEADRIGVDLVGQSLALFLATSHMTARFQEKLEWPEKLSTRGESTPTFAPRIGFGDDRLAHRRRRLIFAQGA